MTSDGRKGMEGRGSCRREAHSFPFRENSIVKVQSIIEHDNFVLPIVLFGTGLKKEGGKR